MSVQRWVRRGLVFVPPTDLPWMASHAALPVVKPLGDRTRVYFSGRDGQGRARIGWFELDMAAPDRLLAVSPAPALDLGDLGGFDDSGVTGACIVEHDGRQYLYYSGWTRGVSVPFYFYIGLAISEDGGETFRRASRAPVLERSDVDPFLTASPCVLVEDGLWRMWYVSCVRWVIENGQPKHFYHVRYAESGDGIAWLRHGHVCIDFEGEEHAIARPFVLKEDGRYKMWYCARGAHYRIGYAESDDGLRWRRMDDALRLEPASEGWDAEMQCYPAVFDHGGGRWMLYNGNGYGRSGIGLAELDAAGGGTR